jgi:hypothetical protein
LLAPGPDLGQRFIEALNTIRGWAVGCEFTIPAAIDFKNVNVRWTGPGGTTDVVYAGSADRCDPNRGGWYYDVDPANATPTRVRLCEATCNQVKGSGQARVELLVGCTTKI